PCTKSCSHGCFKEVVHTSFKYGRGELPGRGGQYNRIICNTQMTRDEETAREHNVPGIGESVRVVKYCRKCELSCPVGKV
ncbi:MAG: epoxyqueuosine reductase, partial [Clostridia bacterium]|nr:epoxyqueuosine reductase [Clostridia bacterium]